jgi:hypothetical protein
MRPSIVLMLTLSVANAIAVPTSTATPTASPEPVQSTAVNDGASLQRFGDPSARALIDERAHAIYDTATQSNVEQVAVLTRNNPLSLGHATGTEATGYVIDGFIRRIVANVWTTRGRYALEYLQDPSGLVLVYESLAQFEDVAPKNAWHNFLGLPAWERRTYFDSKHTLAYAETCGVGAPGPGADASRLSDQAQRLTALLQRQLVLRHRLP